uniref:Uncharacterized protein n=1 Tax=Octopus bimaculoides TaxID=37653 RepID=A0A0L8HK18_OCTBM
MFSGCSDRYTITKKRPHLCQIMADLGLYHNMKCVIPYQKINETTDRSLKNVLTKSTFAEYVLLTYGALLKCHLRTAILTNNSMLTWLECDSSLFLLTPPTPVEQNINTSHQ